MMRQEVESVFRGEPSVTSSVFVYTKVLVDLNDIKDTAFLKG